MITQHDSRSAPRGQLGRERVEMGIGSRLAGAAATAAAGIKRTGTIREKPPPCGGSATVESSAWKEGFRVKPNGTRPTEQM